MKTSDQWRRELLKQYKQDSGRWVFVDNDDIARIQADALEHAAEMVFKSEAWRRAAIIKSEDSLIKLRNDLIAQAEELEGGDQIKMKHPVMGFCCPDPIGQMLGTGYNRFESETGIDGLFREPDKETLLVLAVRSTNESTGQFRDFWNKITSHYHTITFCHVMSAKFAEVLRRYGCRPVSWKEIHEDGTTELMDGYRWHKTKNS